MKRSYFREFLKNEKAVDALYHSRCTYSNAVKFCCINYKPYRLLQKGFLFDQCKRSLKI